MGERKRVTPSDATSGAGHDCHTSFVDSNHARSLPFSDLRTPTTVADKPATVVTMELSTGAVRVLGCLVEKQMTTPDVYPMSLNGIVTAANQSTNRDPVLHLSESEVHRALDELRTEHRLVRMIHAGAGSRVDKYRHALDERLTLSSPEQAVLAMLALRGPQTVAEVKVRTERMVDMDVDHVERVVDRLADPSRQADPDEMRARSGDGMMRPSNTLAAEIPDGFARPWDGPLVVRLPRLPGQKEPRVMHLLGGPIDVDALATGNVRVGAANESGRSATSDRLVALESAVARLEAELATLSGRFESFRQQF